MHDFHLADQILKVILEQAAANNFKKITRVKLELGSIVEHGQEVMPENLRFNLSMLAEETPAAGLEVEVKKVSGNNWILKEISGE